MNKNKMSEELKALLKGSTIALVDAIEKSLDPVKAYLAKFSPEMLQDEEVREDFLFAMAFYQDKTTFVQHMRKMLEESEKEDKKAEENGPSFGFLKDPAEAA